MSTYEVGSDDLGHAPSAADLTDAICRAVDACNLRLARPATTTSHHAYQAGLRDAYLKVLATLGTDYAPHRADSTFRLGTLRPTGPDLNRFEHHTPTPEGRRTTVIDTPAPATDVADLTAAIVEGVTA